MKLLRDGLIAGLSLASLVVFANPSLGATLSAGNADGTPHLLTELLFHSTTQMFTSSSTTPTTSIPSTMFSEPNWSIGAHKGGSVGVQATTGPGGTTVDAIEGSYPNQPSGGQYIWAFYNLAALKTEDIYIEFWAKMPGVKEGCKFVKVFGDLSTYNGSTGAANTTVETDFTSADYGAVRQISFGDGSTMSNDTQNTINLTGLYPQSIGRSYGIAKVLTPQGHTFSSADWGTGWHHFKIHIKFNSGTTPQNEVPNGEYFLEIDGKVYVDATGLYNRNPGDGPINHIGFFGWAQTEPQAFQVWYYDIRISTGGFVPQVLPDSPTNVGVQ